MLEASAASPLQQLHLIKPAIIIDTTRSSSFSVFEVFQTWSARVPVQGSVSPCTEGRTVVVEQVVPLYQRGLLVLFVVQTSLLQVRSASGESAKVPSVRSRLFPLILLQDLRVV